MNKSPEGEFDQAMDHLKSYKVISKNFDGAKKTYERFTEFVKNHENEVSEIRKYFLNLDTVDFRPVIRKDNIHPLYPEYEKLLENYSNALSTLQKSLKILSQQLDDGITIQGKCPICEKGY